MDHIPLQTAIVVRNLAVILGLGFVSLSIAPSFTLAQGATSITSTVGAGGLGTVITPHDHTFQITGGTRSDQGSGTNLFHSFDQFNVGHLDTALFLNTSPSLRTDNILSRVTGGNPSSILGTIDTTSYPGASFFLMNPAGIVFGPNATLDVAGSVAFTTANYLRLAGANGSNASIFNADPTPAGNLTSAPVTAFGFLGTIPAAAIEVQGSTLTVQTGQAISLIGGDITVESGKLASDADLPPLPVPPTPGRQVYLASVASRGEIFTGTLDPAMNINGHSFEALGTVTIKNSNIDTSGHDGTIRIRGGRLEIDHSTIFTHTGDISLDATSIQITNNALIATEAITTQDAGNITVTASGDIDMLSNAQIGSFSTNSSGRSGDVAINSTQGNLTLTGDSTIFQDTNSIGNAGNIKVVVQRGDLKLTDSSIANKTSGTGTPGDIYVKAQNLIMRDESKIGRDESTVVVNNGDSNTPIRQVFLELEGRLDVSGGSFLNTGSFGPADSIDLVIKAPSVLLFGKNQSGTSASGLYTQTISSGNGGRLRLSTDNLRLANGGILSSKSSIGSRGEIPSGRGGDISIEGYRNPRTSITIDGPGSGIFTSAEGTGSAGNIDVKATSVTVQNSGTISAKTSGPSVFAVGGSIVVNATDHVTLNNGASITASSEVDPKTPNSGIANAGNISIDAGQRFDMQDSRVTTEAKLASGGNIDIKAIDLIRVVNGQIISSVQGGPSTAGGNITIDPKTVVLQNAQILANAEQGTGGNIGITTPLFLKDPTSIVDASSRFGLSGTVLIQSPTSNLSGTVGQLASKTNPPQVLLQNRCVALAGGEQSTFILAGRDALPSEPGGWLSSPVAVDHWTGEGTEDHASGLLVQRKNPDKLPILAALQDKSTILSLRHLTPPGFLIRTFATGTTGCPA